MNSTPSIMNKGMSHLLEKLGVLDTEIFIRRSRSGLIPRD